MLFEASQCCERIAWKWHSINDNQRCSPVQIIIRRNVNYEILKCLLSSCDSGLIHDRRQIDLLLAPGDGEQVEGDAEAVGDLGPVKVGRTYRGDFSGGTSGCRAGGRTGVAVGHFLRPVGGRLGAEVGGWHSLVGWRWRGCKVGLQISNLVGQRLGQQFTGPRMTN